MQCPSTHGSDLKLVERLLPIVHRIDAFKKACGDLVLMDW
jgi:hypothetical protein